MFLTPQEWKAVKDKLTRAAPKLLIVLTVLVIGFWSGWYMKGSDVVMDCKYANAFRFESTAFTCQRKI
jgi:hypothetical protein